MSGHLVELPVEVDEVCDDERGENSYEPRMWSAGISGSFRPTGVPTELLPPGQYMVEHDSSGLFFQRKDSNLDELIQLPDSATDEIVSTIETFWNQEDTYRKLNFLWKRGVLLYGPPGSGKTSTVQLLAKQIENKGGLAFYVNNPHMTIDGLQLFRRVEPQRPIVVIMEDIDAIISDHGESGILALLDGERQIDNVCFVATTNYPEKLDKRLVNRPSRFDIVKHIGMPSSAARKTYLEHANPRLVNTDELEQWVFRTEGFSVAHLKELIISVEVFNYSVDASIEKLSNMIKATIKDDDGSGKKSSIGFI